MVPDFQTPFWPISAPYLSQDIRAISLFLFLALQSNFQSVSARAVFTGSNTGSTHSSAVDIHADHLAKPQMEISLSGNAITNSNSRHLDKSVSSSPVSGRLKPLLALEASNEEQDYSSSGFQLSFHHLRVPQIKERAKDALYPHSLFANNIAMPIITNQNHNLSLLQSLPGTPDHVPPYSEDIIPSYDLDYLRDDISDPTGQEESVYMMDQPSSAQARVPMQSPIQKFYTHNSLKSSFNQQSPFNSKLDNHNHQQSIIQPLPKTFPELFEVDENRKPKTESTEEFSQFPSMAMPRDNMLLRNIVNHHATHSTGKDQDEPSYYYRLMFSVFDLNDDGVIEFNEWMYVNEILDSLSNHFETTQQ